MGTFDAITKYFDSYSRVARLYPALIVLAPVAWSAIALFPGIVDSVSHSAMFAISAACLLYFLTSITRSRGKLAEVKLLKRWGGWPTTNLLRHRDPVIDPITKARYHAALADLCGGLSMPTPAEEAADPNRADDIYRSATKKLIEKRRGPEFGLIHGENASYGFRRNLYGLKPVALVETALAVFFTGAAWWLITPQPYTRLSVAQSVINYPHLPLLIGVDIAYALVWLWAVNAAFVLQSGKEYGEALLRSLD